MYYGEKQYMLLFEHYFNVITHWKYFVAHLNDVHAFGYNSAGSEQIWMKFGELLSILFGAGPDTFWA